MPSQPSPDVLTARWWWSHALLPLGVLAIGFAGLTATGLDHRLLEPWYDPALPGFPLRHHFVLESVCHTGGKWLVIVVAVAMAIIMAIPHRVSRRVRIALAYTLVCLLLTTGAVGLLKATTHRYPPWSLQTYGGKVPDTPLLVPPPAPFRGGGGWPAGHAGSGFAWICLYFVGVFSGFGSPVRWLAPGMVLGGIFAMTQHLRGAHFPSHNLVTIAIAWVVAILVAWWFNRCGWWSRTSMLPKEME